MFCDDIPCVLSPQSVILFSIGCIPCGGVFEVKIGMVFDGRFKCVDKVFSANTYGNNVVCKYVGQDIKMACG